MRLTIRGALRGSAVLLGLWVGAGTAIAAQAAAQAGTIAGRVTDQASQRPLIGAQVLIAGTTRGAFTDQDGRYRLDNVPAGEVQLRVRVIGYVTATRAVAVAAGQTVAADFALVVGAIGLDAVVVTATGEQMLREIGNPIGRIAADEITEKMPLTNMTDLLTGRTPGVVVTQSGGTTGAGARVRIRGSNSLSISNEPVIYLDGVRIDNSANSSSVGVGGQQPSRINDLNPDEYETVELIHGPSAAALYGTSAANGIVQIRSKVGRPGPARWTFYTEGGSQWDYTAYPANFNALDDTLIVVGTDTTRAIGCILVDAAVDTLCTQDRITSFNPLETNSPFRTGARQQYGATVQGGSDQVTYFLLGELEKEDGIYRVSNLNKTSVRANLRAQLNPRFDVTVSTGFVNSNLQRPQNDNNSFGILASGLLGLTDTANGGYGFLTPAQSMSLETWQRVKRFTGGVTANWSPVTWLKLRGVTGIDFTSRFDENTVFPGKIPSSFSVTGFEGSRAANRDVIFNTTATFIAAASFDFSPTVRSNTAVGVQFLRDFSSGTRASGRKLVAGNKSLGGVVIPTVNEFTEEAKTFGTFIEEQVGINDRLFLTAAVRGDDNSAFGAQFDFITYPKLSASWVISDEPFFPRSDLVNSLRLRGAWGRSGLQPGTTDALLFFDGVAVSADATDVPGTTFNNLGNPKLKPERTAEIELGFDADVLRERLHLGFTYYSKSSKDALIERTLPPSLGASPDQFFNLGEVSNKGVEISLDARVLDRPDLRVDVGATAWGNRNRIVDIGDDVEDIVFGLGGASQRHRVGFPAGSFFVLPFSYSDVNNDGLIALSEITVGSEETYHGTPLPTHGGTLSATISFKNRIQLYGLLDGRFGHRLFNSTEEFRCGFVICRGLHDPSASLLDQARSAASSLTPVTTEAGFIEDAGFVKLREISLTLFAPEKWAQAFGGRVLSVTVSGRNLVTWTDYTGFDPEINFGGQPNFTTADFLSQPPLRYFTARLNVSF